MGALYLLAIALAGMTTGVLSVRYTECPEVDPEFAVHLPHETDCNKFYKCSFGQKHLMVCPLRQRNDPYKRLYFNPELEVCDWPWNVTCTTCNPNCPRASVGGVILRPHESNCSLYYACVECAQDTLECPEGEAFDKDRLKCVPENVANCANGGDEECPPPGSCEQKKIPHECICSKYYLCKNGDKVLMSCPTGQKFDVISRDCVPACQATCAKGTQSDKTCPRDGLADVGCKSWSRKMIPHECQCRFYYVCKNGEKIRRSCPNGTAFDFVNQRCVDEDLDALDV